MSDAAPKSAYELEMERLRKKDAEEGVTERPPSEAQKAAIAEARQVHEAKVAERRILHQAGLARTPERPSARSSRSSIAATSSGSPTTATASCAGSGKSPDATTASRAVEGALDLPAHGGPGDLRPCRVMG